MHSGGFTKPRVLFCAALGLILSTAVPGCKDNENCAPYNSHEFPPATLEVRVNESNFNPADWQVEIGTRVEWQNRVRDTRTVISGTGPADTLAGRLFDETLLGYCPGEAIGGRFQYLVTLDSPDTIYYFNSLLPAGYTGSFRGRLIVKKH